MLSQERKGGVQLIVGDMHLDRQGEMKKRISCGRFKSPFFDARRSIDCNVSAVTGSGKHIGKTYAPQIVQGFGQSSMFMDLTACSSGHAVIYGHFHGRRSSQRYVCSPGKAPLPPTTGWSCHCQLH